MRVVVIAFVLAAVVSTAGAACPESPADQIAVALARVAIDDACPCAAAASQRDYRRCATNVVRARVASGELRSGCAKAVRKCARASTCGRPGTVACCTPSRGGTRCRVLPLDTCNARGRVSGACASCCEGCNPGCSATTTTTLPSACGDSGPTCDGTCAAGSHCDSLGIEDCACVPDGQSGCGEGPYPACGGVCAAGSVCQAVQVSGTVSVTVCDCVAADSDCGLPGSACTAAGRCAAGRICGVFVAGGSLECGCLQTTTTVVTPTTTTTTLAPGTACGDSVYPTCGGTCPTGEICQSVRATSFSPPLDVSLCQCVASTSTCASFLGGTCPGACPTGEACTMFVAGGVECGCTDP